MKRRIIIIVLLALAVLAVFGILDYLRKGKIEVLTNDGANSIRINRIKDGVKADEGLLFEEAGGEKSVRVVPGTYEISVFNKTQTKTKRVELRSRQTVREKFDLHTLSSPEPVTNINGRGVSIFNSEIMYLNSAAEMLSRLRENGESTFVSAEKLESVKWSSAGSGLAVSKNGGLFSATTNALARVPLSPQADPGSIVGYDLTSSGKVFLASNADIFAGTIAGVNNKIYSADVTAPRIVATDLRIALISLFNPDGSHGENAGEDVDHFVDIIDENGKRIAKKEIEATGGAWSPDGKRFVAFNQYGKSVVYDDSLNEIAVLPVDNVSAVLWLDDESILAGAGNNLSKFDIGSEQSDVIANMPASSLVSELSYAADRSYVYVVAGGFESGEKIYRLGLSGQQLPDYAKTLDIIFPEDLEPCFPNFVNLTSPVIVVRHPSIIPAAQCLEDTQKYMRDFDLDTTKFRFRDEPFSEA